MHLLLTAVLLATPAAPRLLAQSTPADPAPAASTPERVELSPPPSEVGSPIPSNTVAEPEPQRARLLGVQLGAGVPDGFSLSAVARPIPWVRGSVGLAHNVLGLGVQGSVTAIPFEWGVTPTFTLSAGRYFETDVSDDFSGTFPSAFDPALRKFGYDFYSAQLGVEFGSHQRFLFFLRGGLAWIRSGLDDIRDYRPENSNTIVDVENPSLSATIPTVNLGFILYVW